MKGITKGEWVEYRESDGELWIISGEVVVAKVCADDYSNPLNIAQSEETESNARLIYTAGNLTNAGYNIEAMPQLVDALELVLRQLNAHNNLRNILGLDYDAKLAAINAIKSAKL